MPLRQRDILAVKKRFKLDRGARVAKLLDEGQKLVELLRIAHGKAQQAMLRFAVLLLYRDVKENRYVNGCL